MEWFWNKLLLWKNLLLSPRNGQNAKFYTNEIKLIYSIFMNVIHVIGTVTSCVIIRSKRISLVCVSVVWVCENYVVHHLVGTGVRCASTACFVHHQGGQNFLGRVFFGAQKNQCIFGKYTIITLGGVYCAPYLLEDKPRTKSMLSFSGPLHFHHNSLNNALFWKWPLN